MAFSPKQLSWDGSSFTKYITQLIHSCFIILLASILQMKAIIIMTHTYKSVLTAC